MVECKVTFDLPKNRKTYHRVSDGSFVTEADMTSADKQIPIPFDEVKPGESLTQVEQAFEEAEAKRDQALQEAKDYLSTEDSSLTDHDVPAEPTSDESPKAKKGVKSRKKKEPEATEIEAEDVFK